MVKPMPPEKRLRIHPEIHRRSVELRQPQTPAEQRLWAVLRDRGLGGYKFRRQHPIGPFIVDFYCAEVKLAIEVDGEVHMQQVEYDAERTEWLETQGCRVMRFANEAVMNHLEQVAARIKVVCESMQKGSE